MTDIPACRNPIAALWKDRSKPLDMATHSGLLLARYLQEQDDKNEGIRHLLSLAKDTASRATTIYLPAYQRWLVSLDLSSYPGAKNVFSVKGRLVIGLGSDSVLETGLTLHHTYGTPLIPGSALKGLAAHYCDRVWGLENPEFKKTLLEEDEGGGQRKRPGKYFVELFGTHEDSGHIVFHDAWISPETLGKALQLDVMTPHHGDYYSAPEKSNDSPPTDYDDPNPVHFLSITGDFLLALQCDVPGEEGRKWVELSLELLRQALKDWGIGGKTSSGYGRMLENDWSSSLDGADGRDDRSRLGSALKPVRKYDRGDRVSVTRVADSKKKKKRFQTDDGLAGVLSSGEEPAIELGEQAELWIATASDTGYGFTSVEPKKKKKKKKSR